jgi:predicted ATPase
MLIQNEKLDLERAHKQEQLKPTTAIICIEEPEVSLHPCYQSLLADILFDAVKNYGGQIGFIVETHSEYLIRKMQALVSGFSEEQFKENPFAVYYFTHDGDAYDLGFKKSGRFERDFGPGFFDESANLKYVLFSNETK